MNSIPQLSVFRIILLILPAFLLSSCLMEYHSQEPALVKGADIDQTLLVSRDELKKKDVSESMGIWVLKDQVITPNQAKQISELYLEHIDGMTSEFNIWHASWAISNLYRLGSKEVKAELETAYQKAKIQPDRIVDEGIKKIANQHINGDILTTGFIHFGGASYAYDHLVVPGNKKYIQSYKEYLEREEK